MEYAIWIAGEGYINTANIVIEALCVHYPNDFPKQRTPCAWGFEFLWHKSRRRPACIEPFWGAPPDDATLWAAYSDIQQTYPQTNDEKARALVVADAKILVGNLNFHTYNVNICAEVALEMGMKAKAEDYFDHSIRLLQAEGNPVSLWRELMRSFPLADMIISGRARKITGTTPEEAIQRAKTIVQEIEQWRSTHAKRVAAARDRRAHLRGLPLQDLLNRIRKDLRKDPASQSDIEAAEERLKITLPASYTEFLLLSNGIDFIPSINMPGIRSVKELKWESAEDLGLDELSVNLGLATPSLEDLATEVPKFGRVLMISQEVDDEYLWLLEPSQVENAWNVLRQDGVNASGWRVALWRNWQVNIGWYEDFRDYLASVAQRR
ncbi:hypothetical protein C8R41DRAFT_135165 [Lentinula lateritia]|uniref:Knr4/Smi1-like domain-containing protein n=1 Tax=Lentinula lateritia TaxID=40482 RepID=A0ABQ8VQ78_9AGAR|nr:hypothetical protein C8R41DRAFT_135165 [Lentinula lateritia]